MFLCNQKNAVASATSMQTPTFPGPSGLAQTPRALWQQRVEPPLPPNAGHGCPNAMHCPPKTKVLVKVETVDMVMVAVLGSVSVAVGTITTVGAVMVLLVVEGPGQVITWRGTIDCGLSPKLRGTPPYAL